MLRNELLQIGNRGTVLTHPDRRLVSQLERRQVKLLEPPNVAPRELLERQAGQWTVPPQAQSLGNRSAGGFGIINHLSPRLANQAFEAERVDVLSIDTQRIPGRLSDNQPPGCSFRPVGLQHLTKSRNVDPDVAGSIRWRLISPQLIDDPVCRENAVGVDRKQRLLFG